MLTCLWRIACPENPLMHKESMPFPLSNIHARSHTSQRPEMSPTMLLGPFRASPALLAQPHPVFGGDSMELDLWAQRTGSVIYISVSLGKCMSFLLLL